MSTDISIFSSFVIFFVTVWCNMSLTTSSASRGPPWLHKRESSRSSGAPWVNSSITPTLCERFAPFYDVVLNKGRWRIASEGRGFYTAEWSNRDDTNTSSCRKGAVLIDWHPQPPPQGTPQRHQVSLGDGPKTCNGSIQ